MISNKDWQEQDVIDSRDIIERIEELESEDELDEDNKEELNLLKAVADQAEGYGDWQYGEILINEDYFVEYCEELVKDIGELPKELPSYLADNIDWKGVAEDLKVDYTTIDVGSNTFYMRS